MTYRAGIEARAREAAEAARDEVLHAELRGLENLLACCRDEPIPDKQQIDEIRRTIKWVRRQLRLPPSGERHRPRGPRSRSRSRSLRSRRTHVCWHEARNGAGAAGNHANDLLIMFGACRADGERWFWSAKSPRGGGVIERHGVERAAVRARIKAHEAVVEIADGRPDVARENDDRAAWTLRKLWTPPERPKAARSARRSAGRNDPLAS